MRASGGIKKVTESVARGSRVSSASTSRSSCALGRRSGRWRAGTLSGRPTPPRSTRHFSSPSRLRPLLALLDLVFDPEEFELRGRELYLRYPNGFGRSKMSPTIFEKALATSATVRTWKVVTKLAELARV